MKIYIATKNERKIDLAKKILSSFFSDVEVIGCEAKSEVSDTPWGKETYDGARNRSKNSLKENVIGDFGLGLETGLVEKYGNIYEETWCCITDKKEKEFWGYSSGNVIPEDVLKRFVQNKDTDTKSLEVFNQKDNSWQLYSGNMELRDICLENAIRLAAKQISSIAITKNSS